MPRHLLNIANKTIIFLDLHTTTCHHEQPATQIKISCNTHRNYPHS
uniref:Uncharacterized protein n=1 Tax=Rhizophora mucronata TaxID=61149 RepID=A0A2P2NMB0_RHIMU